MISARIVDFDWHPMVEHVASYLDIQVQTTQYGHVHLKTEEGSIEKLRNKFGFTVNGSTYDFSGFVGKACWIVKDDINGFYFHSFQ